MRSMKAPQVISPFLLYRRSERRIDDRQAVSLHHRLHIGDPEYGAELLISHLHRTGAFGRTGSGLREGSGHRRVERDIPFHFLHDLVDVTVQYGDRTKSLEKREGL